MINITHIYCVGNTYLDRRCKQRQVAEHIPCLNALRTQISISLHKNSHYGAARIISNGDAVCEW